MWVAVFVWSAVCALMLFVGQWNLRSGKQTKEPPTANMRAAAAFSQRGYGWSQMIGGMMAMCVVAVGAWVFALFYSESVWVGNRTFANRAMVSLLVPVGTALVIFAGRVKVVDAETKMGGGEVWWSRRRLTRIFGLWLVVSSTGVIALIRG